MKKQVSCFPLGQVLPSPNRRWLSLCSGPHPYRHPVTWLVCAGPPGKSETMAYLTVSGQEG